MNSESKKPGPRKRGPKGVSVPDLLFWEHEWHWVFQGALRGIPSRQDWHEYWEPTPPPKRSGNNDLYKERVRMWEERRKSQAGYQHRWYQVPRRGIPPEPEVWRQLTRAQSGVAIVKACVSSAFWLDPKRNGRPYVVELREHPGEFLKAKKYRYPASDRPSSEKKRVLHFARAMAGTMEGIGAARAIDLIRLLKHGATCHCVQCEIDKSDRLQEALFNLLGAS